MNFRKTKWVIGISFVALGLAIVLTTNLPNSLQYYLTVDEFSQDTKKYDNQEIKLAGKVVPGSIVKSANNLDWNFNVENNGKTMPVQYHGAMPDTFKDDAEVVVTGTYKDPTFAANHVLAKCASRYEEKLKPNMESKS